MNSAALRTVTRDRRRDPARQVTRNRACRGSTPSSRMASSPPRVPGGRKITRSPSRRQVDRSSLASTVNVTGWPAGRSASSRRLRAAPPVAPGSNITPSTVDAPPAGATVPSTNATRARPSPSSRSATPVTFSASGTPRIGSARRTVRCSDWVAGEARAIGTARPSPSNTRRSAIAGLRSATTACASTSARWTGAPRTRVSGRRTA